MAFLKNISRAARTVTATFSNVWHWRVLLSLLCSFAAFTLSAGVGMAANASNNNELRDAITNAVASETITITDNITTEADLPQLTKNGVTITGDGSDYYISGRGAYRLFDLTNAVSTITLDSLTLTGGYDSGTTKAGALYTAGPLAITTGTGAVVFDNNSAGYGGAIYADNTATLTAGIGGVTFSKNSARNNGGAIYTFGNLTLTGAGDISFGKEDDEESGNSSSSNGGAIYFFDTATLSAETGTGHIGFYYNKADDGGGAIRANSPLTINTGSGGMSFSGNTAGGDGGAISVLGALNITTGAGALIFKENAAYNGGAIYGYGVTITAGAGGIAFIENKATSASATYGGAISSSDTITLNADAGDIYFTGNTSGGSRNAIGVGNTLVLQGAKNIIFDDPIAVRVASDSTTLTSSAGLAQFGGVSKLSGTSGGGEAEVTGGDFRVLEDAVFNTGGTSATGKFTLAAGTLSGAGTVLTPGTITLSGTVAPTGKQYKPYVSETQIGGAGSTTPGSAIGTLSLEAGSTDGVILSGATLAVDIAADGNSNDKIAITGNVKSSAGSNTVSVSSFVAGTYDIMTWSGSLTGSIADFSLTGTGVNSRTASLDIDDSDNKLVLTLNDLVSETLTWTGGNSTDPTVWKHNVESLENWKYNGNKPTFFHNGDSVVFDSAVTNMAVAVDAASVTVDDMTVSITGYSFSGGKISGDTLNLNAAVASTTTFTNEIDFTGGITVAENNTLSFNYAAATTNDNAISGAGNLTKWGTGSLTLTGNLTYTGVTTVNGGKLVLDGDASLAPTSKLVVNSGEFDMSASGKDQTVASLSSDGGGGIVNLGGNTLTVNLEDIHSYYGGVIAGTGSLVKNGSGILILIGENTYTGGTTVNAGMFMIGNGIISGSISGNIVNNATVVFDRSDTVTYSGVISGSGVVGQVGSGTLILTGNSTNTGVTEISDGTLQIGNGGTSGMIGGDVSILNAASALVFNRSGAATYTGNITANSSNRGTLKQEGPGTLTLNGNVGSSSQRLAAVTVADGTLAIAAGKTVHATTVTVDAGKTLALVAGSSPVVNAGTFATSAGSIVDITGYSDTSSSARVVLVQADNDIARNYTLTVGGNALPLTPTSIDNFLTVQEDQTNNKQIALNNNIGLVWNNNNHLASGLNANTAHGTFNVATTFTVDSALTPNASASGNAGFDGWNGDTLTKLGAGNLTLTKDNTYTGATTISAGTLTLTGTLGTGAYAGAISNNGALVLNQTSAQTLSGAISGTAAASIAKSGSGKLTLSGDSSGYAGTFTQSAGEVALNSTTGLGGTFVQNAGTFTSINGATLGAATFKGTVTPTGTLNVTSAAFDGAAINLAYASSDTIIASDNVSFANTTIAFDADTMATGTYTLIDYNTVTAESGVTVTATNIGTNRGGSYFDTTGTALKYDIFAGSTSLTWDGTESSSNWNHNVSANDNWSTGKFNTWFKNDDDVTFADNGAYRNVTVADSGVDVGTMDIQGDYNFTGGKITASGAVTVAAGKALGLNIIDGDAALKADSVDFNNTGILNITGYTPESTTEYPVASPISQIVISTVGGSGTIDNLDLTKVTVAGQDSVDFLSATAFLDSGNTELKVKTELSWYLDNDKAHGDFTIAGGNEFTLGAVLADETANADWDGETLTKKGEGTLTLTAANTYTGGTELNAGRINIGNDTALGTGAVDMADGTTFAFSAAAIDAGNAINTTGSVTFDTGTHDGKLSGSISGSGTFTKDGAGTLTLTGANAFSGTAAIAEGTLALGAGGSLDGTTLVIDAGTGFDITNAGGNTTLAGLEVTSGSMADTGTNTLVLTGGSIVFDLTGAASGDTILTVTGSLKIDTSTTITLNNAADSLKRKEYIILATNMTADSTVTGEKLTSGRKKFLLSLDSGNLVATLAGVSSFTEATNDYLGTTAPGNVNIQSGTGYLDGLLTQPYADTPGMEALEEYFSLITEQLPANVGARELERWFGAYAAYANQALTDDANRFRARWRVQNHSFLNNFVFRDLLPGTANAGIVSDSGLASPYYSLRCTVPTGQSRIWAGGFGTWAEQDRRNDLSGYKYDSRGLTLGYEYTRDCLNFGLAAAYSKGDLKVNDLAYKNEADILNLALYAAYAYESGLYVEGGLGYGHAWNDYKVNMSLGGNKTAKYGSDIFSADLELGYIARLPRAFNVIPSVGIRYDHTRNGSWTEKLANTDPNLTATRFASASDNALAIPLGVRANKVFRFGTDGMIIPEVRASYVYQAVRAESSITTSFAGAPGGMKMRGVDSSRSHWRFGAGLSGQFNTRVDFRLDYDYETRSGYKGHNVNASVGVSF